MNSRFTAVETSLNKVEFRWKWFRVLEHSLLLASIGCLLVLILGGAIVAGLITSKPMAITLFICLAVLFTLAWFVMIIIVAAASPDRNWLAAAVEHADRRMMDRLNT